MNNTKYINKSRVADRASKASGALEQAWRMIMDINKKEIKIPLVVMVILSFGDRKKKLGHHSNSSWNYRGNESKAEVGISPALFHSPENLLATMLHEAAHAALADKFNAGMGSTSYYHTKVFRKTCIKLGLKCEFYNTGYGWTLTSWADDKVPERYLPIISFLTKNLPMGTRKRKIDKINGRKLPESGHIRLTCQCEENGEHSILVTKKMFNRIYEKGGIKCEVCHSLFIEKHKQS